MERKPIRPSKFFLLLLHLLSEPSTPAIEITILVVILIITSATASVLPFLPYQYKDGARVPTLIFEGLPATFRGFIISLVFAFSGAFSALFIQNKPKIARFFGYYSMVSMSTAVLLLLHAASSYPIGRAAQ